MNTINKKFVAGLFDEALTFITALRKKAEIDGGVSYLNDSVSRDRQLLEVAKICYKNRRVRENFFDGRIFGEPAWNILLELFIKGHENKDVSVKSICIASGVPPTTALRWLLLLEEEGLVLSSVDTSDARRRLVKLSPHAFESMARYLQEIIRAR